MQVVAAGHGGPLVADEGGKPARFVELLGGLDHLVPAGFDHVGGHFDAGKPLEVLAGNDRALGKQGLVVLFIDHAGGNHAEIHQDAFGVAGFQVADPALSQRGIDNLRRPGKNPGKYPHELRVVRDHEEVERASQACRLAGL